MSKSVFILGTHLSGVRSPEIKTLGYAFVQLDEMEIDARKAPKATCLRNAYCVCSLILRVSLRHKNTGNPAIDSGVSKRINAIGLITF